MPTISVDKEVFIKSLGKDYTNEEFDELCFEFGIELDEDTTEDCEPGERPQLKIEVPANRYDLLCHEGISRALNVFLGNIKSPQNKLSGEPKLKIVVEPQTQQIRQYAAGAVLRGVKFNQLSYDSFISLQDKLHSNLCRNRTLVAIGTHDLDKITGTTIRYRAPKPEDFKFVPLKQEKEFNGKEIMDLYENDKNLGKFLHIIKDSPGYPLYVDEADQVLSMPPIINSEATKITLDTKDIFIDLTGTDKTKIEIVVNEICAMFSEYCTEPFTIEPVEIVSPHNNESRICPDIRPRETTAEVDYINSCVGVELKPEEICKHLAKMGLDGEPSTTDPNLINVKIPPTRPDILHQCDIMEDVAIGYGYNNLKRTFPDSSYTIANASPVAKASDILRREAAMAGWAEVMPLTLCSHDENFAYLKKKDDNTAVKLANPKTSEYQVVRTSLLPGLLKTVRENRDHALPMKVFEAGDIVVKDDSLERMARNGRKFAGVYVGKTAGFEVVHGLLDRMMKMLRINPTSESANERGYWIAEAQDIATFFPGRGAQVYMRVAADQEPIVLGSLGVLHPEVLANFDIPYVASSLEIDVQPFVV